MKMLRLYVKDIWYHVVHRRLLHTPVAILMYHSIGNNKLPFTVTPESFRWQMSVLKNDGLRVARLMDVVGDLKYGRELDARTVVLTFDDGYEDNLTNAFSVLEEFGFPATVFVSTNFIGATRDVRGVQMNHLSREQLVQLQKSGLVDIQPHGMSHRRMTELSPEEIARELSGAQHELEEIIGLPRTLFAYPFGDANATVEREAAKHFKGALGVRRGYAGRDAFVYNLPRQSVDSRVSKTRFRLKI
jgi:peptidoglycan/xylan/chitin deacetylase (PgdA/CDA1 family)